MNHPDLIPYLRRWVGDAERFSDDEVLQMTNGTLGRAQIELHLAGRDLVRTFINEFKKDWARVRRALRR